MTNENYQSNLPRVKYVLEANEKAALKAVGKFVRNEARRILSTVTQERTGRLRKSIGYFIRRKTKSVEIGTRKGSFYALFIEKGHKYMPKNHYFDEKSGKERITFRERFTTASGFSGTYLLRKRTVSIEFGGRMVPAHPFLTPAAQQNIRYIQQIVADNMGQVTNGIAPIVQTDKVEA